MSVSSNDKDDTAAPVPAVADAATVDGPAAVTEAVGEEGDSGEDEPVEPSEERPMLRPLEAFPIDGPGGQKLLALYDPSGMAPQSVTLPPLGAAVIDLCDGTRTRAEILADFATR